MGLVFCINSIEKNVRSKKTKETLAQRASILLEECIETVEARVKVSGVPSPCSGVVNLSIDYFEENTSEINLHEFEARAKSFAKEWCVSAGIS
ncbi:hypothetical protein JY462_11325 [Serratia marcescens]|nr:hypothetical protein [Serratia marcescens]